MKAVRTFAGAEADEIAADVFLDVGVGTERRAPPPHLHMQISAIVKASGQQPGESSKVMAGMERTGSAVDSGPGS